MLNNVYLQIVLSRCVDDKDKAISLAGVTFWMSIACEEFKDYIIYYTPM